ncbi:MAG: hypothetical protein AAFY36_16640 [Bacteroidota bacterium]
MDNPFHDEQIDERFAGVLLKALEKKNLDGFDYLEFKQSMAALHKQGITGETAIKSAYAMATTMGLSLDKLVKSAEYYRKVLQDEKGQFEASMQKHYAQNVEGKRKETGALNKKIADWQGKIDQLKEQIAAANAKIEAADAEIDAAKKKGEETQRGFEAALQVIDQAIVDDLDQIKSLIDE